MRLLSRQRPSAPNWADILATTALNRRPVLMRTLGVPAYPADVVADAARMAEANYNARGGGFDGTVAALDAVEHILQQWEDEQSAWDRAMCVPA